jgi:hypothetical protein
MLLHDPPPMPSAADVMHALNRFHYETHSPGGAPGSLPAGWYLHCVSRRLSLPLRDSLPRWCARVPPPWVVPPLCLSPSLTSHAARTAVSTWSGVSTLLCYSDQKVANRNGRDFGWEIAHAAVSRRPPSPLTRTVAHTHMYTNTATVRVLSLVQGPFSCRPVPNRNDTIHNFSIVGVCARIPPP